MNKIYNLEIFEDGKIKRGYSESLSNKILAVQKDIEKGDEPSKKIQNRITGDLSIIAEVLLNSALIEISNNVAINKNNKEKEINRITHLIKKNLTTIVNNKEVQLNFIKKEIKNRKDNNK